MLRIRHIGYAPAEVVVILNGESDARVPLVLLRRIPLDLGPVVLAVPGSDRRLRFTGFEERRRAGFGSFLAEDEIAAIQASVTSDVVRLMPGVQVLKGLFGTTIRFARTENSRIEGGPCAPRIFLDGMVVSPPVDLDQLLVPGDIAGIEVYRGPAETPARFGGAASACGVLAIWTK